MLDCAIERLPRPNVLFADVCPHVRDYTLKVARNCAGRTDEMMQSETRWTPAILVLTAVVVGLIATALVFGIAPASGASNADARASFMRLVAAQNAHDAGAVRGMLWNSPKMLWYTRGTEVRGPEAVVHVLRHYFAGTWHLDPDMSDFHATAINSETLQILVPIVFTRGDTGGVPQQSRILIDQTYTLTAAGWRVASIFAVANTKLK
jgi:hypothetical protein